MEKPVIAQKSPIAVDVKKEKLIIGVHVEKVLLNHFVTDHIKELHSHP